MTPWISHSGHLKAHIMKYFAQSSGSEYVYESATGGKETQVG